MEHLARLCLIRQGFFPSSFTSFSEEPGVKASDFRSPANEYFLNMSEV